MTTNPISLTITSDATISAQLEAIVNYDFKLTIGQNYDVEMGFYQSGFLKMILAG